MMRDEVPDEFAPGLALVIGLQVLLVVAVPVVGFAVAFLSPLAGISGFFLLLAYWAPAQILLIAPPLWRAVSRGRVKRAKGICAGAILVCLVHTGITVANTYAPPWE